MTTDKIIEMALEYLEEISGEEVTKDTKLEHVADSLDVVDFTMRMERSLDIAIPDDRSDTFSSLTVEQVSKEILAIYEFNKQS